jgi:hypothetical protein
MPAPYCGDDFVGARGPCEGLGLLIMLFEEAVDGSLEVDDGAKDAALEPALGEGREEAFGGVEPTARMTPQPFDHLGVLVSGVVVEDGVDRLAGRDLALDGVQKPDELLMPVALHATADDLALQPSASIR